MPNTENKPLIDFGERHADYVIDARGLKCPMPLLKMKQALNSANDSETVLLRATDPASERDISAYIAMTSHVLYSQKTNNEYFYWVSKNAQE